jgi:hypothetical protein
VAEAINLLQKNFFLLVVCLAKKVGFGVLAKRNRLFAN